jgi:hypothetical protein
LRVAKFVSFLSRKYFLSSVIDNVKWFLFVDSDDCASGSMSFMTFGFANVEIIRKNNNKKNMMSLSDDVGISA